MPKAHRKNHSLQIPLIYLLVGGLWIFFSDLLLDFLVTDPHLALRLQTFKGWFFVFGTALLLHLLIRHYLASLVQSKRILERINRALQALSRFDHCLIHTSNEPTLLTELCRIVVENAGYRMAWVGMAEQDATKAIRPAAHFGSGSDYLETLDLSWAQTERGRGPAAVAIRSGEPVVVRNIKTHPEFEPWREAALARGFASLVALPLCEGSTPFGVLVIYSGAVDAFNPEEITLLQELAADLGYGVLALRARQKSDRAEETIRHMAFYDPLTGLPNQNLVSDLLAKGLPDAQLRREMLAVLFLDIDKFSKINRTLGHAIGDRLLQICSQRFHSCLPETATLARWGSDIFLVLQPHTKSDQDSTDLAQRILSQFEEPFEIQSREIFLSASIGIAIFPADATDAATLLKNAETALYRAKRQGGGSWLLYTPFMHKRAHERLALEGHLRRALERQEFFLNYQPQVDAANQALLAAEVLVRWHHAQLGMIAPGQFIPLAEETGLIVPLGAWVLRTACAQGKAWQEAGLPPLRLAVNLSARQFLQQDLVSLVRTTLEETGFEPGLLELEITESAIMEDVDAAVQTLLALKDLGVSISIDDFGTGYSSLAYLKRFPIDMLKIDRSFIMGLPDNSDDAAIVTAIIAMAHNLKLQVIAEGVETAAQRDFLLDHQCHNIQGYLFSKPLAAEEFIDFWQERDLDVAAERA